METLDSQNEKLN